MKKILFLFDKASLLKKLPYTGDLSACRLTGEMALAYADLLNSHHQYALRAALFDGGSGIPMLWVALATRRAASPRHTVM